MEPSQFLESVWAAQGVKEGYVFISYKHRDGSWHDKPIKYPTTAKAAKRVLDKVTMEGATDLYFCPNVFKDKHRRLDSVLPSVWLYADLDPVDPSDVQLAPTTAMETSNRRFQCLWRVKRPLNRKQHRALNQRLTYLTQADKGGWSLTKVLRIPNTQNFKREPIETVRLMWHDLQHYQVKTVVQVVRDVKPGSVEAHSEDLILPEETAEELLHKYKERLPKRARKLLQAPRAEVGERSDRLWELECLLLDAGVSPAEVLVLVRDSVWNKYSGTRRELPQLWKEIQKAVAEQRTRKLSSVEGMKLIPYSQFLEEPTPTQIWTVEGIWSYDAHGLIAGEPKTFKSFIATDLAVSVASGTEFLGRFRVPEVGPVIIIQEENTPAMMKDRLEKIAFSRQLTGDVASNGEELTIAGPEDLPIFLMNNQRFNLTDEDHLRLLEKWIIELKPKLVVLDPIYLMIPGIDENSAVGMVPVLRDLLTLKQKHGVGILFVHHYNKPRDGDDRRAGNRISGTGAFYRWFESAVYLEKGQTPGEVILTPEHRGAAPAGSIHLDFDIGEMGESHYQVDVEVKKELGAGGLRRIIRNHLEDGPIPALELAQTLDISKDKLLRLCQRMDDVQILQGKSDGRPGRPPLILALRARDR